MNILVTGGTGFLGSQLAHALLAQNHRVVVLGRNFTQIPDLIAAGTQPLHADLRDRNAIVEACRGMDAVYHVGALSAPWGNRQDFYEINVKGTEHVIAGCEQHGVSRLINVSSPSVLFNGYDQTDLTDTAPYPRQFTSIYSESKKLAEDRLKAAQKRGLATINLRPKAIFGPGDTALLPRLIKVARAGRLPQIGDGRNRVDLTYVDNVVHALLLALDASSAVGNSYTITNDEHPLLWEVIRKVLRSLGIADNLRAVPYQIMWAAARTMEQASLVTRREPLLTTYTVAILCRTQTYDITAAKQDLGYRPVVSLADGIERTLQHLKGD